MFSSLTGGQKTGPNLAVSWAAQQKQRYEAVPPYGLPNLSANPSAEEQRELLRQQLLGCGVDFNTLPPGVQQALYRIQAPTIRTLHAVVKFLSRIQALKQLQERNDDLLSFVYNRAPNAEVAVRLQSQCDEFAAAFGSSALQKLNTIKKMVPKEPRSEYYTQCIYGFEGLQERVFAQSKFFQTISATFAQLKERELKAQERFEELAVKKLQAIRLAQSDFRDRAISLMAWLNDFVIEEQGFLPDEEDVRTVRDAYERILRNLESSSEGPSRQIPLLRKRIQNIEEETLTNNANNTSLIRRAETARASGFAGIEALRFGGSSSKKDSQEELCSLVKKHEEDLDHIRRRLRTLQADVEDLMAASKTVV